MTDWELEFTKAGLKAFEAMPARDHEAMGRIFDRLIRNPRGVDLKKLQGRMDEYRIRSGRWRAVVAFDQGRHIITVLDVDQRKDVYR